MVRPGNVIKHSKFMDVAFEVTKVRGPYGPNERIEVSGWWLNQGYVNSWNMGVHQKLRFTVAQLKADWSVCMFPHVDCIRDTAWKPLR